MTFIEWKSKRKLKVYQKTHQRQYFGLENSHMCLGMDDKEVAE
jgi:hypothetical protein